MTQISSLTRTKKFDAQPIFVKAGLLFGQKYASVRKQDFYQRIVAANLLKAQGTNAFNQLDFAKAARIYGQALVIFRYVQCSNPQWEKEAFSDEDLTYVDEEGKSAEDRASLRSLKLALYLNLSMCYLRTFDYRSCREACYEALKIDESNSKALYRTAKAIMSDTSSTFVDYEEASNAIKQASAIDPMNQDIQHLFSEVKTKFLKMQAQERTEKKTPSENLRGSNKQKEKYESSKHSAENFQGLQGSYEDIPGSQSEKAKPAYEAEKKTHHNSQELLEALTKSLSIKDKLKIEDISCSSEGEDCNEKKDEERMKENEESLKENEESMKENGTKPDENFIESNTGVEMKSLSELKEFENFLATKGDRIVKFYECAGKVNQARDLKERLEKVKNVKEKLEALSVIESSQSGAKTKEMVKYFGISLRFPDLRQELRRAQKKNLIEIRNLFEIVPESFELSKFEAQEPLQRKISRILNIILVTMATLLFGLTLYHQINQKVHKSPESIGI